ncbi:hypothetical protein [Hominibacterium faecale]|uniref:hypothetical protein n=1 Tax=Hominibacterium faecale TaxID=2839743 RepID=UPI0022B2A63C|nr:hypothetical protein [Hominibacterium faecale]
MKRVLFRIISIIKKNHFILEDVPDPPIPKRQFTIIWSVWIVGAILVFKKLMTGEFLTKGAPTIMLIVVGMVPSIWIFCSKEYVKSLKKSARNLVWWLYRLNLIWIILYVIGELLCRWILLYGDNRASYENDPIYGNATLSYLAVQCVFLSFWFLSISLVLVYKPWLWGIQAAGIIGITAGYYYFLKWYIGSWDEISFVSLCLTVGGVVASAVSSYKLSKKRMKTLFSDER